MHFSQYAGVARAGILILGGAYGAKLRVKEALSGTSFRRRAFRWERRHEALPNVLDRGWNSNRVDTCRLARPCGGIRGAELGRLLDASKVPLAIGTVQATPQSIWVVSLLGVAEEVRLLGGKISHFYFPLQYFAFLLFLLKSFLKGIVGYIRGNPRMAGAGMNDVAVAFLVFGLSWILVGPVVLYFAMG